VLVPTEHVRMLISVGPSARSSPGSCQSERMALPRESRNGEIGYAAADRLLIRSPPSPSLTLKRSIRAGFRP